MLYGSLPRSREAGASARYDAGDHTIIVGQVLLASHMSGSGLIFEQGEYGHFTPFKPAQPTVTHD